MTAGLPAQTLIHLLVVDHARAETFVPSCLDVTTALASRTAFASSRDTCTRRSSILWARPARLVTPPAVSVRADTGTPDSVSALTFYLTLHW